MKGFLWPSEVGFGHKLCRSRRQVEGWVRWQVREKVGQKYRFSWEVDWIGFVVQ